MKIWVTLSWFAEPCPPEVYEGATLGHRVDDRGTLTVLRLAEPRSAIGLDKVEFLAVYAAGAWQKVTFE